MVAAALALALLSQSDPNEFTRVDRRVDCQVTLRSDAGDGGHGFPETIDYVFLLLRRQAGDAHRRRLLWLATDDDGDTWFDRGTVSAETGDRWPDFSATFQIPGGTATLASDPRTPGRITYRSFRNPPNTNYQIIGGGTCELSHRRARVRH